MKNKSVGIERGLQNLKCGNWYRTKQWGWGICQCSYLRKETCIGTVQVCSYIFYVFNSN